MIKKTLLLTLAVMFIASFVNAEEIKPVELIKKVPLKSGIVWSLTDHKARPSASTTVFSKLGLNLDVGYVGEDELALFLSYPIINLEDFIDVPILNLVELELGAYYGFDRINHETRSEDYGINVNIIKVKF